MTVNRKLSALLAGLILSAVAVQAQATPQNAEFNVVSDVAGSIKAHDQGSQNLTTDLSMNYSLASDTFETVKKTIAFDTNNADVGIEVSTSTPVLEMRGTNNQAVPLTLKFQGKPLAVATPVQITKAEAKWNQDTGKATTTSPLTLEISAAGAAPGADLYRGTFDIGFAQGL
jgi:hypothetical protein